MLEHWAFASGDRSVTRILSPGFCHQDFATRIYRHQDLPEFNRARFQLSRVRSSENNLQLSDGRGRNANVQQASAYCYRESRGHHGIRLVEGIVRVHLAGRQNGT